MTDGTKEPTLRIGPFSLASGLSVKALRSYHDQGILVPAAVDPATGYRVYTVDQLLDATVLRRLRALDVPLKQVRDVLTARDPEVTERVLAEHARTMNERLQDTLRIIDELQRGIDAPQAHTPVHLREVPARHALTRRAHIPESEFASFLGAAYEDLFEIAGRVGAEVIDAPGALYPSMSPHPGEPEDVTAFVPIDRAVDLSGLADVALGELPATSVAVAVHIGAYEESGETYRQLGRWVATNAAPRDLPVREIYVVGPPEPVDRYRTEIHWPVEGPVTEEPS